MWHIGLEGALLFVGMIVATVAVRSDAGQPPVAGDTTQPTILLQVALDEIKSLFIGSVDSITKRGDLRIAPLRLDPQKPVVESAPLVEGYYLGIVPGEWKDLRDARLLRVQVREILTNGEVHAQIATGLEGDIQSGMRIFLLRPPQASTAQMKSLPNLVTVELGQSPPTPQVDQPEDTEQVAARSVRNLTEIGKALRVFVNTWGRLPPASLIGPDGKAWHSWRVLLLPSFHDRDCEIIFRQYRFDEPWDGSNNRKLLQSMPRAYFDQPPDATQEPYTRYAAVTGPNTTFSAEGSPFDGKQMSLGKSPGRRLSDFVDGAANTLAVGTLPKNGRIPWTKPEDIIVGDKAARIGAPGGFGAPYQSEKGRYALFLAVDGAVTAVQESVDQRTLLTMLRIDDRSPQDLRQVEGVFLPRIVPDVAEKQSEPGRVIYLLEESGEIKARLVRPRHR